MNNKVIAVVKQPTISSIVRALFYILYGAVIIAFIFTNVDMVGEMLDDMPLFALVVISGYIFPLIGLPLLVIAIASSGFKEMSIIQKGDKIVFHKHILKTALFSKDKTMEMDIKSLEIKVKTGNPLNVNTWYKVILNDDTKKYKLVIFKFKQGDIESLKTEIENLRLN